MVGGGADACELPAHNISVCSVQYYCFALCLPVCDMCCLPRNNSDHPQGTREKQ